MNQKEVIIQNMSQKHQEPSIHILNDTISIQLELPSKIITSTLEIQVQENTQIQANAKALPADQKQVELLQLYIKLPKNGVASFKSVEDQAHSPMMIQNDLKNFSSVEIQTENESVSLPKKPGKRKHKSSETTLLEKKAILPKEEKENESALPDKSLFVGNSVMKGATNQDGKQAQFDFYPLNINSDNKRVSSFGGGLFNPIQLQENNGEIVSPWLFGNYQPHEERKPSFPKQMNIFTNDDPFGKKKT